MNYKIDYLPILKENVKEKRYIHTLGVVEEALLLSKIYGVDLDKARIAATLHDYTKYLDKDKEKEVMIKYYGSEFTNRLPDTIYHGFTSSVLIQEEFGIDDVDIINAIRYHSIGRKNMTTIEKIIYIADFAEPGRNSDISRKVHEIAINNLDLALYYAEKCVIETNQKENKLIPAESFEAFEYIKEKLKIDE